MMDFSRSKYDIIGRAKVWYAISLVLLAVWLVAIAKNVITTGFPLVRGIDFEGGSILQLRFDNWPEDRNIPKFSQDVKILVDRYTERAPQVQTTPLSPEETGTGTKSLILQIRSDASLLSNPDAQENLYNDIRQLGGEFISLEETEVGAVMGKELTTKAVQGVFIGLLLILIYITVRLSFDFALFAIVGLFHDVLVVIGVFALFGLEINSSFVAILLTVVGYSINDTIIIYDRIRENMKVKRHLSFDVLVNQSLLETMARSINTTLTTVLAIMALLVFGGLSLRTFMLGLGVGITTGAYSSIFICAPLLVSWRMRGRAPAPAAEAVDVAELIRRDEESLADLFGEEDEEEEERVEPITVTKAPSEPKVKRQRPKRRRRR